MAWIYRLVVLEGYRWWKTQETPEEKVTAALAKLHQRHYVLLDPGSRSYRRKNGLPVARVVLAPAPQGGKWPMMLLATRKLKGEEMWDVNRKPPEWPAWREKTGQWEPMYCLAKDPTGRWTWALMPEVYRLHLEEALSNAQAGHWDQVALVLKWLGRLPSFRGVHLQRKEVLKRVKQIWGDRYLRIPGPRPRSPWEKVTEDWPTVAISPLRVKIAGPPLKEVLAQLEKSERRET